MTPGEQEIVTASKEGNGEGGTGTGDSKAMLRICLIEIAPGTKPLQRRTNLSQDFPSLADLGNPGERLGGRYTLT